VDFEAPVIDVDEVKGGERGVEALVLTSWPQQEFDPLDAQDMLR
jgi:hypothetical protein